MPAIADNLIASLIHQFTNSPIHQFTDSPIHQLHMASIGIIGGSGLYDMAELTDRREERIVTPFGEASAAYVTGPLRGQQVAFLARHGVGHRLLPSELNFRANIF